MGYNLELSEENRKILERAVKLLESDPPPRNEFSDKLFKKLHLDELTELIVSGRWREYPSLDAWLDQRDAENWK